MIPVPMRGRRRPLCPLLVPTWGLQRWTELSTCRADTTLADGGRDRGLSRELQSLAEDLGGGGDAQTQKRKAALGDTLDGIARKLR